jgi:hypothetical protein
LRNERSIRSVDRPSESCATAAAAAVDAIEDNQPRVDPESDPLTPLRDEFDRELAVPRSSAAADRLRAAFASTPDELAKAANAATPKT